MNIETFEIEETTVGEGGPDGAEAVDEEARRLAKELGLEGQQSLVTQDERTGEDRRIPYPRMSKADRVMYGVLFPTQEPVAKYRAGILPLRIMQIVAHARGLFEEVQVWHPGDAADPDPILVGKSGRDDLFLLARWGTALRPAAELRAEARRLWIQRRKAECRQLVAHATAAEMNVETDVEKAMVGEYVANPSYY